MQQIYMQYKMISVRDIHRSTKQSRLGISAMFDIYSLLTTTLSIGSKHTCPSSLTPLFLAAKNLAITKLLLKCGADVHAKDDKHDTPLHYATSEARQSMTRNIVSFLLQAGADISAENNEGITPLNLAAQNSDLLSLFLTHLDPSNPQYKSSGTSIIEAVLANSQSCLEILLKLGFDVNSINISRKTALDIALELASPVMLPTLLRYQAKPGLKWDVGSEFIQQWKNEEWFPRLIRQIKSTRIDTYIHQFFAYETVEREGEVVVNESSPDVPYLEVTVPSRFDDVQGVIFHVVSHDQGISPNLPVLCSYSCSNDG